MNQTRHTRRRRLIGAAAAAPLATLAPASRAQADWPARPVRLVVPSGAGGPTDTFARLFSDHFAKAFKQQFLIDNKPGANGIVGNDLVAKAAPDGYTLLFTYAAAVAINHTLIPKMPYDALRDLQPIAQIGAGGNLLVVTGDFPARTLKEFIDVVRAAPDKYDYASWGIGSGGHLAMEALKIGASLAIRHVPYKTVPQIYPDLFGGVIKVAFVDSTTSLPHIRSGKIRALVGSGTRRGPALPDLPTMTESGIRFDVDAWYGMFAPTGTPMAIVRRVNEEVNRYLVSADMRARFNTLNMAEPPLKTAEQFAQTVKDDIAAWGGVIKSASVKPEG
ncbi:MAG: Bug family tripartite tricarboxylate transporter substrate binding protein [Burkholderiales bacterium]